MSPVTDCSTESSNGWFTGVEVKVIGPQRGSRLLWHTRTVVTDSLVTGTSARSGRGVEVPVDTVVVDESATVVEGASVVDVVASGSEVTTRFG